MRPVEPLLRQVALATVVAETINIDVERRCGGIHLEANGLPLVDADAGRKALNRIVSGAADVPLGVGRARVQVFTDDRIGPALGPGMLIRTLGNGENQRGRQAKRPGDRPARKQHECMPRVDGCGGAKAMAAP